MELLVNSTMLQSSVIEQVYVVGSCDATPGVRVVKCITAQLHTLHARVAKRGADEHEYFPTSNQGPYAACAGCSPSLTSLLTYSPCHFDFVVCPAFDAPN